jgi:multidrug resistance protein, MATE family
MPAVRHVQVIVLWQFTKPILLGLKQSETVAELSSQYIKRLSIGFPATCGYEATRRFLQSQGISAPMFIVCVVVDALHPLWNYALIYWAHQGFLGAAWATVMSQWLLLLLLVAYITMFKPHKPGTWVAFSTEAFRGLGEFMKLAVPGAGMVCMEWVCCQVALCSWDGCMFKLSL